MLAFAQQHPGEVEAAVARPGLITSTATALRAVWGSALRWSGLGASISLEELAAAMLEQAICGFETDTLTNDNLRRIGRNVLDGSTE